MANAIPVSHTKLTKPEEKPAEAPAEAVKQPEVAPQPPAEAPAVPQDAPAEIRKAIPGELQEKGAPYLLPCGAIRVDH